MHLTATARRDSPGERLTVLCIVGREGQLRKQRVGNGDKPREEVAVRVDGVIAPGVEQRINHLKRHAAVTKHNNKLSDDCSLPI